MANISYPGTQFCNGFLNVGTTGGIWGPQISSDSFLVSYLDESKIYVAPGRYSSVKKVVFTITFQQIQNAGTLGTTFSARIGPTSTTTVTRTTETVSIPPASRLVTDGATQIWVDPDTPNTDAVFYPINGSENQISPRAVASPVVTSDAQTLMVTFDRDDAGAADFFVDWDATALLGDDEYMAYGPGIQRNDLGVFVSNTADVNQRPQALSVAMTVVQSPFATNDSCTHIPGTNGVLPSETMNGSTTPIHKPTAFFYREADWDGIDSINILLRQAPRAGAISNGWFTLRVFLATDEGGSAEIYTENFGTSGITSAKLVFRSADIKALLVDGNYYTMTFATLTGISTQDLPWGWWEINQKDFSKKTTIHPGGMGLAAWANSMVPNSPTSIGTFTFAADQTIFDPSWYENTPDANILARRWFGGIDHQLPNNTDLLMVLNASLTDDITNSAFNTVTDEVSSTPDASTGWRLRNFTITRADPLNLAGIRVMKVIYNQDDWTSSAFDEVPGNAGFAYTFFVGNSEVLELGPLFELGEFNPEGCASTAAGLGDAPGVLVITNGATIPKKFNPVAENIENAGIDTPYRYEVPIATLASIALSPDGGLTPGVYEYAYTLRNCCTGKESDPYPEGIVVDASGESPAAEVTLNFSGVIIPADAQICEICVYRTIEGGEWPVMAKVGCFDPDVTSIFVDTLSDSLLEGPDGLLATAGLSIFNAPMLCLSVVTEFRNRLFALGDIPNLNPPGTVGVVLGSDQIAGDSETEFDRCVLGKFIQIEGDCTAYEVVELLPPADAGASPSAGMRLVVDRDYEGATDDGLSYIICGHPNRLYISEPLEPECWPGINFLDVDPGDGDRLMGAVSNFNRLVIFKRRKTYVVAFREQPITEIIVPTLVSRDIGCIAPRSVAQVASGSVWLSDRGLALYDGRGVGAVPECSVMNDLFVNPDNPNYLRRDANGRALGAAGVFYPKREQYLLLLPTVKTTRGASMILVWDTELRNVTLLEFCQEFLSIEVAKDTDGNERVYLGDSNGFVWIWDIGDTDGAGFPNATGTVRGTITAVGIDEVTGASYLEDSSASFVTGGVPGIGELSGLAGTSGLTGQSAMGLAGACVFWRPADAALDTPWQSRFIYLSTQDRLYVTPNWGPDTPTVGDDYMVGPIEFRAEFKPANYGTDDFTKRDWRQVVVHEPESVSTNLRTELLRDFQNSDIDEDTVADPAGDTGEGRNYDLGFGQGRQLRPVGRLVHNFMGVRLSNFAPEEPLTIINHLLMMNPRQSK